MKFLTLVVPVILLFLTATTINVYAMQFSFNPSTGEPYGQFDLRLPAALVALVSAAGAFLIIHERKKAKGIWFSDSERLK